MSRLAKGFLALAVWLLPVAAWAQGVLVVVNPHDHVRLPRPVLAPPPTPPASSYKIKELSVQARLTDQVAQVQVSQTFVNTGSQQMEVQFVFPLPYDGAVDQLTLMVDGKEFPAKLLKADEARAAYEAIVRKNRDPALLEWIGTGMFQTSVFPVPAGAERKVTMRYSQVCRMDHGVTDFLFPLSTAKYTSDPLESLVLDLNIESSQPIKNIYSPTHTVDITRNGDKNAHVTFKTQNDIPAGDFRLMFDVAQSGLGASLLSYRPTGDDDGFWLLLASPSITAPDAARPSKTVIFVVDKSGSMEGEKINQAKSALKFVLNNLREGDLFNIVAYDSVVQTYKPELQNFNEESRQAAIGYAEGIYAGGGTNINDALQTALRMPQDSTRPTYVIFLTDGLPTEGETGEMKIVENAKAANGMRTRILALGVGYDVNSRLLDRVVRANYGQSEYVRPDESIESHVSKVYNRINAPVLSDVAINFEFDGLTTAEGNPISRTLPSQVYDLFEGEQLVLVGRYRKSGAVKVRIDGRIRGEQQMFSFPASLADVSSDARYAFVEKLWAVRRVGEIIDQLDLVGQNDELVKELVALSTKHGILTQYTSFLADETSNLRDLATVEGLAKQNLAGLAEESGRGAFAGRAAKGAFQNAQNAAPGGIGGGGGGRPDQFDGLSLRRRAAGNAVFQDGADQTQVAEHLKNVGNKSFFQRGSDKRWVDSTVTEEMETKAIRIVQFSDEYFSLAAKNGREMSQYLAMDDAILVNIAGQAYMIDPAP